jgi:thioredoxin-related protein
MQKIIFSIFLFVCFAMQSQNKSLAVFSFEEVEKLQKQNPKPIVIFIHTDWCKYCDVMDKNTLTNEKVTLLLNESFYFIKLNAEEKKTIHFLGKTFAYTPFGSNTGIHELAKELALKDRKISYPTTIFLNKNYEIDLQLDRYIKSKRFATILEKYVSKL